MSLLKKSAKIVTIILIILITVGYLFIRNISRKALPDYNRNFYIENLISDVTIVRDSFAVASVIAENESDLYRAVGFIMAQDRLWQMDLLRRATTGRLSEIFGEDLVDTDLLMRALRIEKKSAEILERSDDKLIDALKAFSCGVNQFIELHISSLPPEFSILGYKPEKWQPEHSINLISYMAWDLNMGWNTEVVLYKLQSVLDNEKFQELIPDLDRQTDYIFPDYTTKLDDLQANIKNPATKLKELGLEVFSGSNNWAVSGNKSKTGKPILANDMHLGLFAPGIWYQMHQVIDGELNVTGVMLPGQPFLISGHNDSIAWGMTNVMLDDVDFYLETINPQNPHQYKFMEEWKDMEVVTETIFTGKDSAVEKELLFTHRGPVISDLKELEDKVISMRWTGNLYSNEVRSVYLLNRANNWHDFRDAVKTFISVSQNINYADVNGNIGLQTSAGIPVREGKGALIVPGVDDTYDWQGVVPFEELPYSYNPPEGFVVSANNRTAPDNFPYHISHWFDLPDRYNRIKDLLTEKDVLSEDDFKLILADKRSNLAERMMPGLLNVLVDIGSLTQSQKKAVSKLKEWDFVYDANRAEPLIFEKFYVSFMETLLMEEMGEELYSEFISSKILVRNIIDKVWFDTTSVWINRDKSQTWQDSFGDIVGLSFFRGINWIEERYGSKPDVWRWGDVHRMTLNHPMGSVKMIDRVFNLNRGPFETGGSFHTVCPYSYNFNNRFRINHGASQRHIYSAANWNDSWSVIPTGTSGIPSSKYYCDQTPLYVNDQYRADKFTIDQVVASPTYRMKLLPVTTE